MPCFRPVMAFRNAAGTVAFRASYGFRPFSLACGKCMGCRLERTRQWAVRCMHEHQNSGGISVFLTLTYSDENLPPGGTLVAKDLQDFIKRCREWFRRRGIKRISYFGAGEYGDDSKWDNVLTRRFGRIGLGRPHYHVVLFGVDFLDKTIWKSAIYPKLPLYRSPSLEKLWTLGHSSIGSVTMESCQYVTGYCIKKVGGVEADGWYMRVDRETGECFDLVPEFARMSLRPAIGKGWYKQFSQDVWKGDSVVVGGREQKPPRYYTKLLSQDDPLSGHVLSFKRRMAARDNPDGTLERLAVRGEVKSAFFKRAKGSI